MKSLASKLGLHRRPADGKGGSGGTEPPPPQQQLPHPSSTSNSATRRASKQQIVGSTSSQSLSSAASGGSNKSSPTTVVSPNPSGPSDAAPPKAQKQGHRQQHQQHGILHHNKPPMPPAPTAAVDQQSANTLHDHQPTRVRFAPQQFMPHLHQTSSLSSTHSSPSQVHLMACGASVASASVGEKDSIFDRVLREENERLSAMGMGPSPDERSEESGAKNKMKKKDPMRGGRRVEV